jgi:hypothetical protein
VRLVRSNKEQSSSSIICARGCAREFDEEIKKKMNKYSITAVVGTYSKVARYDEGEGENPG